jgi:hypothetical protein
VIDLTRPLPPLLGPLDWCMRARPRRERWFRCWLWYVARSGPGARLTSKMHVLAGRHARYIDWCFRCDAGRQAEFWLTVQPDMKCETVIMQLEQWVRARCSPPWSADEAEVRPEPSPRQRIPRWIQLFFFPFFGGASSSSPSSSGGGQRP